jgi:GTP1/Obg family GTP-binding protein
LPSGLLCSAYLGDTSRASPLSLGIACFCSTPTSQPTERVTLASSREQLSGGLQAVLNPAQRELVTREKALLEGFGRTLESLDAEAQDVRLLRNSMRDLEELFMLVVVGEFNSGKSSFLNALLGHRYLAEGVTPTTQKINLIKFGEAVSHGRW